LSVWQALWANYGKGGAKKAAQNFRDKERGEMVKTESVFSFTTKGGLSASRNVGLPISCAEGMKVISNSKKNDPSKQTSFRTRTWKGIFIS
jgi:hypothetical protein